MTTKIEIKTNSYNQRRFGKPWIAVVNFESDPKGTFNWGSWIGNKNEGTEGLLVIDANDGDIIARGQKDFRGNNSISKYYQVKNGELVELADKAEAYKLATAK